MYSLLSFPHFFPQLTRAGGSKNRPPPACGCQGCIAGGALAPEDMVFHALQTLIKQLTAKPCVMRSRLTSCVVPSSAILEYDATPWCEVLMALHVMVSEKATERRWTREKEILGAIAEALHLLGGEAYLHCAMSDAAWRASKDVKELAASLEVPSLPQDELGPPASGDDVTATQAHKTAAVLDHDDGRDDDRVWGDNSSRTPLQRLLDRCVPEFSDTSEFADPVTWETRMAYSHYEALRILLEDGSRQVVEGLAQLPGPLSFPKDTSSPVLTDTEKFMISLSQS